MKKSISAFILLIILFFFSQTNMKGQKFYGMAGGGYQYQYFVISEINYVLQRFNENHTPLIKPMKKMHSFSGLSLSAGVGSGKRGVVFSYGQFKNSRTGTFSLNGQNETRTLKMKNSEYTLAYNLWPFREYEFVIGMGLALNYLKSDYFLAANQDPFVPIETHKVLGLRSSFQFYLHLNEHFAILLKPYYTLNMSIPDFFEIHNALNPSTADTDHRYYDKVLYDYSRAGCTISLIFVTGEHFFY